MHATHDSSIAGVAGVIPPICNPLPQWSRTHVVPQLGLHVSAGAVLGIRAKGVQLGGVAEPVTAAKSAGGAHADVSKLQRVLPVLAI